MWRELGCTAPMCIWGSVTPTAHCLNVGTVVTQVVNVARERAPIRNGPPTDRGAAATAGSATAAC